MYELLTFEAVPKSFNVFCTFWTWLNMMNDMKDIFSASFKTNGLNTVRVRTHDKAQCILQMLWFLVVSKALRYDVRQLHYCRCHWFPTPAAWLNVRSLWQGFIFLRLYMRRTGFSVQVSKLQVSMLTYKLKEHILFLHMHRHIFVLRNSVAATARFGVNTVLVQLRSSQQSLWVALLPLLVNVLENRKYLIVLVVCWHTAISYCQLKYYWRSHLCQKRQQ